MCRELMLHKLSFIRAVESKAGCPITNVFCKFDNWWLISDDHSFDTNVHRILSFRLRYLKISNLSSSNKSVKVKLLTFMSLAAIARRNYRCNVGRCYNAILCFYVCQLFEWFVCFDKQHMFCCYSIIHSHRSHRTSFLFSNVCKRGRPVYEILVGFFKNFFPMKLISVKNFISVLPYSPKSFLMSKQGVQLNYTKLPWHFI